MLLLDVGEECGVAEVVFAAGTDEWPLLAVLLRTLVHTILLFIYYSILLPHPLSHFWNGSHEPQTH